MIAARSKISVCLHGRQAMAYLASMSYEALRDDPKTQDAILRKLEIIGEAARRLSDATRQQCPIIPWHAWIALRNRLMHAYDIVDLAIVRSTVQRDIPALVATIEEFLSR